MLTRTRRWKCENIHNLNPMLRVDVLLTLAIFVSIVICSNDFPGNLMYFRLNNGWRKRNNKFKKKPKIQKGKPAFPHTLSICLLFVLSNELFFVPLFYAITFFVRIYFYLWLCPINNVGWSVWCTRMTWNGSHSELVKIFFVCKSPDKNKSKK